MLFLPSLLSYSSIIFFVLSEKCQSFSVNAEYGQLFQGNSIMIVPSNVSSWPGDAYTRASNFYGYVTTAGYFSFGWWLSTSGPLNHSHCRPDASRIDWYEYTPVGEGGCDEQGICRFHAINTPINRHKDMPVIDNNYTFSEWAIGPGALGRLAYSYIDTDGGAHAVGSRRLLCDRQYPKDGSEKFEGALAFETMKSLHAKFKVPLAFDLVDFCFDDDAAASTVIQENPQKVIRLDEF